ncbi:MAG: tRNA pseudouridine(55) synthase TruB [Fimbriimonadaceae bacterium]
MTSHDVVDVVRRRVGTRRVGHAGTLDPMATGLLVVAVGPATRFLQYLSLEPKEYTGEIVFGRESTTQDAEGELSEPKPVPSDLEAALLGVLPRFLGLIEQIPPAFSAVKVGGKPLYKYARTGQEVERAPRSVHIGEIEILESGADRTRFRVRCSGGTYVRTLAHDLGRALGCGAYLNELRRTRAGRFHVGQALSMDEISAERLMPLAEALAPMPSVALSPLEEAAIRQGRRIPIEEPIDQTLVSVRDPDGLVFGIARVIGNQLQPECVLPIETAIRD